MELEDIAIIRSTRFLFCDVQKWKMYFVFAWYCHVLGALQWFNFRKGTSVTNDALHHLHYLHVNFKSLVMKEEEHPKNIDTMEQYSKMLGLRKICIPNPPQRQLFSCLHFIPTLNKFILLIIHLKLHVLFCGLAMIVVSFASSPMHVSNLENDIWPISIIKTWKKINIRVKMKSKEPQTLIYIYFACLFSPKQLFHMNEFWMIF